MTNTIKTHSINIQDTPKNSIQQYWLEICSNALHKGLEIPVIVARGNSDQPVLGITAAIHGNEINGIATIHEFIKNLDIKRLNGTILAVPVCNVPSYMRRRRRFPNHDDLNRIMPGNADGNVSDIYAYGFYNKILKKLDYLVDLHTASFGRINSYYVRANTSNSVIKIMAELQNPRILLHSDPTEGTLRHAAQTLDIPAITVELGDPNIFQPSFIERGVKGIQNILDYLSISSTNLKSPNITQTEIVRCHNSYWLYADQGGLLNVKPALYDTVKKGDLIATLTDVFGHNIKQYSAPETGIVIGKSNSPVGEAGARILHLGLFDC